MNQSNVNKKLNKKLILGLCVLGLALVSCSKSNSVESSSNNSSSIITDSNGKALMECNQIKNSNINLAAKLKIFRNDANIINDNYVRLKFTSVPVGFNEGTTYIKIFRGKQAPGQSSSEFNDSFLGQSISFDVESIPNQTWSMIARDLDSIYNDELSLGNKSLTNVSLVLNGFSLSEGFQALQIVVYDANTHSALGSALALVPSFHANPYDYLESHRNQDSLVKLHPFWNLRSMGLSSMEFANKAIQEFCY